jgi:transitional endoplasmic reticulum ATPase
VREVEVSNDRIAALERAVAADPENHTLRAMLAELHAGAGRAADALAHFRVLRERGALDGVTVLPAARCALDAKDLALAAECIEEARSLGVVEGVAELAERLDQARKEVGVLRLVSGGSDDKAPRLEHESTLRFDDVGGLEDVKKTIHRMVILPLTRKDLFARYRKQAGGGVLLYGPPGCGKTLLARATAGECKLPFFNIRIEEVLDPYFGQSEKNLHELFAEARSRAPAVVFLDELDAIGFSRRKRTGSVGRELVDQLLQELDAIGSDNQGMLVLAATNAPWDVDDALKRPGRFDRVVFVSPPDVPARRRILQLALADRPQADLDLDALAQRTALFSGADLRSLVERAVDGVIDEAIERGDDVPIRGAHLEHALRDARATTTDWLRTARNYVEFANHGGRYDDVLAYLDSPEGKAARKR